MKKLLIAAALLALLVSIDAASLPPLPGYYQIKQIVSALLNATKVCNHTKNACGKKMVLDIPEQSHKELHECVFCKAGNITQTVKTEVRALNDILVRLGDTLLTNGCNLHQRKMLECREHKKNIDLRSFLTNLCKFAQELYRHVTPTTNHSYEGNEKQR